MHGQRGNSLAHAGIHLHLHIHIHLHLLVKWSPEQDRVRVRVRGLRRAVRTWKIKLHTWWKMSMSLTGERSKEMRPLDVDTDHAEFAQLSRKIRATISTMSIEMFSNVTFLMVFGSIFMVDSVNKFCALERGNKSCQSFLVLQL